MHVLVVEDDPVSLKLIMTILEKDGYRATGFQSAEEAIEYLNAESFVDIIITDVMMPKFDGFDLLKYLKSNRKFARIPVIISSTLNDQDSVIKSRMLGADDYIVKPIEVAKLIEKLENIKGKIYGAVLIVDDEESFRKTLAGILKRSGFKVVTAADGRDALEILENENITMVIVDVKMPGMTGDKLLKEIKAKYPDLTVFLMDANVDLNEKEYYISKGANGLIDKPFYSNKIINQVERFFK